MTGIVSYGAYVPYWRLQRGAIGATLGSGGGRGTRSVASLRRGHHVDGGRGRRASRCGAAPARRPAVGPLVRHHRAGLPRQDQRHRHPRRPGPALVGARGRHDRRGALRRSAPPTPPASAAGWLVLSRHPHRPARAATTRPTGATPPSPSRSATGPTSSPSSSAAPPATGEFLDRWRLPGEPSSRQWEERFGEYAYLPLVEEAVTAALEVGRPRPPPTSTTSSSPAPTPGPSRVPPRSSGPGPRPRRRPVGHGRQHRRRALGPGAGRRARPGRAGQDHRRRQPGRRLRRRRSGAPPTPSPPHRPSPSVREQLAATRDDLTYADVPHLAGHAAPRAAAPPRARPPRRPAVAARARRGSSASSAARTRPASSTCRRQRVSHGDGRDRPDDAGAHGRRPGHHRHLHRRPAGLLAVSPPVVAAVIDFDGGGRFQCELTDVDPASVKIGDRVEMTFRRLYTAGRRPQLLLEGAADPRPPRHKGDTDMASNGIRDQVAIVGMGCTSFGEHWDRSTDDLLVDAVRRRADLGRRRPRRRRRLLAGHHGVGRVRPHPQPPAEDRLQAGHPTSRTTAPPAPRRSATPATRWRAGAYDVAMAIGVEKLKDSGYSGLVVRHRPQRRHRSPRVTAPASFSLLAPGLRQQVRRRRGGDEGRPHPHRVEEPPQRRAQPAGPVPQGGGRRRPSPARRWSPGRSASSTARA